MADKSFLTWPFFEDRHKALKEKLDQWCTTNLPVSHDDVDTACKELVANLGRAGFLDYTTATGKERLDVRTLALIRESLAYHDGLADFSFAMQGLGAGAITLFGTQEQQKWLKKTRSGKAIPAFALTEPQFGSDVANMQTTAVSEGDAYIINGEKTWISNGGIADIYVLFARTGEEEGARGISAFLMPADTSGLHIAERQHVMAPHPLARLVLEDIKLPKSALIGEAGKGFKIAMSVLDVFRTTVGAAALGMARRALDETKAHVNNRTIGGKSMADLQMIQGHIADMALGIDAAALLIYRAAWTKDMGAPRISREASMAKLFATEQAQKIVDQALQIHGGEGVRKGSILETLYREVRALRIYEGASDVQKIIIARQTLAGDE